MGRELRHVPQNWQHPRYSATASRPSLTGTYRPQFETTIAMAQQEDPDSHAGEPGDYRDEKQAGGDHFQLYENTTEGTPISQVFSSLEDLLEHLATTGDEMGKVWPQPALNLLKKQGHLTTSDSWKYSV